MNLRISSLAFSILAYSFILAGITSCSTKETIRAEAQQNQAEVNPGPDPNLDPLNSSLLLFEKFGPQRDYNPSKLIEVSAKGALLLKDSAIVLQGQKQERTVLPPPPFFGNSQEIFSSQVVPDGEEKTALWVFYDLGLTPSRANAQVAYGYDQNTFERAQFPASQWRMPEEKDFKLVYASSENLWILGNRVLYRFSRGKGGIGLLKVSLTKQPLRVISASADAVVVQSTSESIAIYEVKAGVVSSQDLVLPGREVLAEKAQVLLLGDIRYLFSDGKIYLNRHGLETWFLANHLEEQAKISAEGFLMSRGFGECAIVLTSTQAYRISNGKPCLVESAFVIPENVSSIFKGYCLSSGCHNTASDRFGTSKGLAFDPTRESDWIAVVRRAERTAVVSLVLGDMCHKLAGVSPCQSTSPENVKAIDSFIYREIP